MEALETTKTQELQEIRVQIYQEPIGLFIPQIKKGTDILNGIKTITNRDELQEASTTLNKAKTLNQLITKKVDEVCRPLKDLKAQCDDVQRKVKAYSEEITKEINLAAKELESKILEYHKKEKEEADRVRKAYEETIRLQQEAARKAKEAALAEAKKTGQAIIPEPDPEPPIVVMTPVIEPPKVKGMTTVWKYEIIDVNLIPREYMTPDLGKINAAVKGGAREIQGLKIFEESQIRKV